jgi:dehydrogenase/reductase SDR family protein 7B
MDFNNKVVIITGSSQGIGKVTAIELLKRGASVMLNGRDAERLKLAEIELKVISSNVSSFCADISDSIAAASLIEETLKVFDKIDILINNAGISMRGAIADLKPSVYKSVFDINVLGVMNVTIPALPHIRKSNGSIVFISSIAGIRGLPGYSAYSSSKMALRAIVESLRIEEAKSNVHIGLMLVGFTAIEFEKKTLAPDGSMISIKDRARFKPQSMEKVALEILKNIKKRKFKSTLTPIGILNAFLQVLFPSLVENILIRSNESIKKMS